MISSFTRALLIAMAAVSLAGCVVAPVPPPGRPGAYWVPAHYNQYGAWVPGHYQ